MSAAVRAARVLVQALATLGVRHVVLAPGSRSAPLAYALAEAARPDGERDPSAPSLTLHVRVDERCAGFLALGLALAARSAGRVEPVAVVTTSGTAVANLHPAALEAHHAGLPLLLLTADRPHELRGTGANQTTDQVGLLGPGLRLGIDVPAPTGRDGEDRDLRRVAARAVAAATGARTLDPGPVHLDLAFRDPLVPDDEAWPEPSSAGLTRVVPREVPVLTVLPVPSTLSPDGASVDESTGSPEGDGGAGAPYGSGRAPRTVVVAGDRAGVVARRVAEANGWPLLAEPSSGARGGPCAVPAYRQLLADDRLGGAVERVVVLGRPTLSRPVQALLARPGVDVTVVAPEGADWPDAARTATRVLTAVPPEMLDGSAAGPGPTVPDGVTRPNGHAVSVEWLDRWRRAGVAALRAVREVSADGPAGRLTGPTVADVVASARSGGGSSSPADLDGDPEPTEPDRRGPVLLVGSSNPVRDLDLVADWSEPPVVLANRGLAGIDGTLSTAAGVALGLGVPVRAYVGDLTFLHDVGGLLVGPAEQEPDLQVVVANDDGGSIFALLEHGEPARAAVFERVFGTPHGADLGALCAGYGVAHRRVRTVEELREALAAPVRGRSVVEVGVDRADRRELAARTAQAVADAVGARLDG